MSGNLSSNTSFPPQDHGPAVGPIGNLMEYEGTTIPMRYEIDWFDLDFQKRIPLTVQAGQIPSIQTNFTLLINGTFTDLIGEVQAELRIVDEDNTLLDYEIQDFDDTTGDLIAWARNPTMKDGDKIYIYFDNPGAIDAQNPTGLWTDYISVYHMTGTFLDSTGTNNLTNFGTVNNDGGQIGRARSFNGATTSMTSAFKFPAGVGWVSVWARPCDIITDQYIVHVALNRFAVILGFQDSNYNFFLYPTGTPADTQFTATALTFQKIDVVVSGGTVKIYRDGVLIHNKVDIQDRTGSTSLLLGKADGGAFFAGLIDEVEFSTVIPTNIDDRVKALFNNQNSPSGFFSTGAVENVPVLPSLIDMEYEA